MPAVAATRVLATSGTGYLGLAGGGGFAGAGSFGAAAAGGTAAGDTAGAGRSAGAGGTTPQPAADAGGSGGASGGAGTARGDAAVAATIDCTRPGLAALVDAYLAALSARDPSRLRVSATLTFTENGTRLPLGEGLWKTAGRMTVQRSALDTESCGTATEAALEAADGVTLLGVRLKLEAQTLSEIEAYVVKLTTEPRSLTDAAATDQWRKVLPDAERDTREELVTVADAYFDNLGDPLKPCPFGTPCDQAVNGLGTAQFSNALDPQSPVPHTCGSVVLPLIPGLPDINASPTFRRYPIADVETGIVVALGLVAENVINFSMLKVIDGKIRFIESVAGPAVESPGWEAP